MSDDWIEWRGGERPVSADTIVDVRLRTGVHMESRALKRRWTHTVDSHDEARLYDIMAYRVINLQPVECQQSAPIHAALNTLKNSKPTNPKDAIGVRRVPMSVVPAGVLMETALGLLEGAAKYGRHNYRAMGVQASVYYDAAVGHMMDWWEGEDIDPDSGLSHVTKAICSLIVLRDAMLQGRFTDNRPPRSKVFKRDFNPQAAAIIDKHADKTPHHYTLNDKLEDQ